MHEMTVELAVGDVVVIGNKTMTVLDIDGDEVSFRLDPLTDADPQTEDSIQLANCGQSQQLKRKAR